MLWTMSALERGWLVSVPDHDGPNAGFGAGKLTDQLTLDSLRAALKSESITGLQPTANVMIWGYSGGALATGWALEMQDEYAPELSITAAALGGVPADAAAAIFGTVNKGTGAGLASSAARGLSHANPESAALSNPHP